MGWLTEKSYVRTVTDQIIDGVKTFLKSPKIRSSDNAHFVTLSYSGTSDQTIDLSSLSIGDASTTVKGKIQIATNAEVQAGTDALKAVTPAGLLSAFVNSKGNNGYTKLPNGLIIQWGSVATSASTGTTTFHTTFPNACVFAGLQVDGAGALHYATVCTSRGLSSFSWWVANANVDFTWFAIGY